MNSKLFSEGEPAGAYLVCEAGVVRAGSMMCAVGACLRFVAQEAGCRELQSLGIKWRGPLSAALRSMTCGLLFFQLFRPIEMSAETAGGQVTEPTQLRDMSTDRPDATESPFTVDVGHVQLEMDVVSHARDREKGIETEETNFGVINLRFGVSPRTELGVFLTSLTRTKVAVDGAISQIRKGFGDVILRAKVNAWGNDGGGSAGGMILDLTLPTAADGLGSDRVQGSLFLPVNFDLPAGWTLGAMTGIDLRRDEGESGYRNALISTATVGHDLTERIGVFFELTSEAGDGRHVATFNMGLTFRIDPNLQFDAGANLGISAAAADSEIFAGLSRRF